LLRDGEIIHFPPGKPSLKTVVHYYGNAKMALDLDERTKEQWHRTLSEIDHDHQQIEHKLRERRLSYIQHEIVFDQRDYSAKSLKQSLKQLARLVANSFNTVKEALVLERVLHFDCK